MRTAEQQAFHDQYSDAAGTITIFGTSSISRHYALTCFRVGCDGDGIAFSQTFKLHNVPDIFAKLERRAESGSLQNHIFCYNCERNDLDDENNNDNAEGAISMERIALGRFSEGYFDSSCDILMVGERKVSKINVKFAMLMTSVDGRRKHPTKRTHTYTINQADLWFKRMIRSEE